MVVLGELGLLLVESNQPACVKGNDRVVLKHQ